MKNMIEITGVDLKEFTKKVYELSLPQGLGFLHYQSGGLSDEQAEQIVSGGNRLFNRPNDRIALDMDYISGRACKMVVFKEEGRLYINKNWYDHTDTQLKMLLEHFNINISEKKEHGVACNCLDCQAERFMKKGK